MDRAHQKLEALVRGRQWLAGAKRTLADAYFIGIARWGDLHQVVDWQAYPRLRTLRERLLADPAVQLALAIEHARPASTSAFRGHVTLEEVLAAMTARSIV